MLRALPGNGRNLTPSSPRYFGPAVAGARRAVRISQDHTTWAGAQRRCRWGTSPPRPHRAAWSFTRTRIPHAPPTLERTLCTRRTPAARACALRPSFRPDAAASTASRPANRDDRETPPPHRDGMKELNPRLGILSRCRKRSGRTSPRFVMAGLVPAIHVLGDRRKKERGSPGQAR